MDKCVPSFLYHSWEHLFLVQIFHYHCDVNFNYMSQQDLSHCLILAPQQLQIMTCPEQIGVMKLQLLYVATLKSQSKFLSPGDSKWVVDVI